MRKAKSRNFILIICGVFLFLIMEFSFGSFVAKLFSEDNVSIERKKLINNVFISSSKIRLVGDGNFLDKSPKVVGTEIFDFNVVLKEKNDKVLYSLNICNNNRNDVYIVGDSIDYVCNDELGQLISCENVFVDVHINNRSIKGNELIMANSCIELVLEAEYVDYQGKPIQIYIDKYGFSIK